MTLNSFSDHKLNQVINIKNGEIKATGKSNIIFSTIVGSCVAVCLADNSNQVYGINHFMLPGENWQKTKDPKFGITATNLLIEKMIKKGANLKNIEAKVFGGANTLTWDAYGVGKFNAEFILKYLDFIKIPIITSDLGGNYGRKISFYCNRWHVSVKKIDREPFEQTGRG
jgi:chemotaxis protein CheD